MIVSLIALYMLLLGGASGIETLFNDLEKKDLKHAVADEDARSRILELSKELGKDLSENEKAWDQRCDQFFEIQQDYGSLPVDFEAQAEHLENMMIERHRMVLKTRSAMKELMSEEEWGKVFAGR